MTNNQTDLMDKLISLCKRRGFVFPGSEIYGGLANSWDYGPVGTELKNNIKQLWWKRFVQQRDDMVGIDAALVMNPKVWKASGHVDGFSDYSIECRKCHNRVRVDNYLEPKEVQDFMAEVKKAHELLHVAGQTESADALKKINDKVQEIFNKNHFCPTCGKKDWAEPAQFNLMLRTFLGASATASNAETYYFRPETAQAMFVDFKNILNTTRKTVPFGIAQIGKAFRNEITPGNFIFRTREFEQMEIEYFIAPPEKDEDWQKPFEHWQNEMRGWLNSIGADMSRVHEHDIPKDELAHYSKRTVDFEFDYPFGTKELYGLAYRTDFDLRSHQNASGEKLTYRDPQTNLEYTPHVIEPSLGVDRTFLVVLLSAYKEEGEGDEKRIYLKLPAKLAPFKAAVFPLLKNKPELVAKAREIYFSLKKEFNVDWDDRGNIGKRYYSQDEIGTPYCITVDFQTLEDGTVTLRDRDTAKQERIAGADLEKIIAEKIK